MLTPLSITLTDFKCFTQTVTFDFPTDVGLYFVTGQNQVNPELEANGCGKSTIFCDAPCWCLYGKTPRGLKAGDVINWNSATARVDFKFGLKDHTYRVVRSQSPNSIIYSVDHGDLKTITQIELDDLLGLSYDAFCKAVLFAQFGETFFDLTPTEKSELLGAVLPLEVWEQASKKASNRAATVESHIQDLKELRANTKGRLESLEELDLEDKIEEWEAVRRQELSEVEQELLPLDEEESKLKRQGAKLQQEANGFTPTLAEIKTLLAESEAQYEQFRDQIMKIDRQVTAKTTEISMYEHSLKELGGLGKTCSRCKQEITEEHVEKERNRYQSKISDGFSAISTIKESKKALDRELKEAATTVSEVKAAQMDILQEYNDVIRRLDQVKYQAMDVLRQKKQKMVRMEKLNAAINPFVEQKKKILNEKRTLLSKLMEFKGQLTDLEQELDCVSYWVKGFKEIKLMIISDILMQLELEVNNYLHQLGLHGWKIDFAVDSTTKAGKIRKGFSVTIKAPHVESAVPWAAWSGGEIQRLRLAGTLGMADLMLACNGLVPGLEIFDEPSQYLSNQGITDLIGVLRDRSRSTERQIFMIDHRSLDSTVFDGVFTVVKTPEKVYTTTN